MGSQEQQLLRAIGVDVTKSDGPPLPLNLAAMRKLLSEGASPDRSRDRAGSSALGVAAYLGRVDAMMLLLDHNCDMDSENLDGATPLSLAVFGKSAAAVALLLACGAEVQEAWDDAESTGATECVEIFQAWSDDADHPLLAQARKLAEPIVTKRERNSKAAVAATVAAAAADALHAEHAAKLKAVEARATIAEAQVAQLQARVATLEAELDAMVKRAVAAEQKVSTPRSIVRRLSQNGRTLLGIPAIDTGASETRQSLMGSTFAKLTGRRDGRNSHARGSAGGRASRTEEDSEPEGRPKPGSLPRPAALPQPEVKSSSSPLTRLANWGSTKLLHGRNSRNSKGDERSPALDRASSGSVEAMKASRTSQNEPETAPKEAPGGLIRSASKSDLWDAPRSMFGLLSFWETKASETRVSC